MSSNQASEPNKKKKCAQQETSLTRARNQPHTQADKSSNSALHKLCGHEIWLKEENEPDTSQALA